ncbi:MAG: hypothetical protein SF162_03865 [bacterium]|nr:hypothetical protein [bacterium]
MYNDKNFRTAKPFSFGLAMAGGIGIVLMILALGVGVVQPDANSYVIGMVFVIGLAMMVTGIGAWIFTARPFDHFDDINQPLEDDHGHGSHSASGHTIEVHRDEAGHPITVIDDGT